MTSSILGYLVYILRTSQTFRDNFLYIVMNFQQLNIINKEETDNLLQMYDNKNLPKNKSIIKLIQIISKRDMSKIYDLKDYDKYYREFLKNVRNLKKIFWQKNLKNIEQSYCLKLVDSDGKNIEIENMEKIFQILPKNFRRIIIEYKSGWGKQCEYLTNLWLNDKLQYFNNSVLLNLNANDFENSSDSCEILMKRNFLEKDMNEEFLKILLETFDNNLILFIDCNDYCNENSQIFKDFVSKPKFLIKTIIWSTNSTVINFEPDSHYQLTLERPESEFT